MDLLLHKSAPPCGLPADVGTPGKCSECHCPERFSRMPVVRQRQLQGPAANTSLPTPFLTPAVSATCIESELQHELRGMAEARHVGGGVLGAAGGSFVLGQAAGEFDFASEEMDAS